MKWGSKCLLYFLLVSGLSSESYGAFSYLMLNSSSALCLHNQCILCDPNLQQRRTLQYELLRVAFVIFRAIC